MTSQVPAVIEMRQITKRFGDFYANKDISLVLEPGEIHVLLGENGAGKSTLMNILSGLLEPSAGQILMHGEAVEIDSPSKANRLGIGMVHQHFMLIDDFTILENIILGAEPLHGLTIDKEKARQEILALADRYKLAIDPDARIEDVSVGMQQRVEILKTLYRGADVLIFDEPTAVLTPQEIDELMVTLRSLAREGKSMILITHKLDEIKEVGDRCTIIRRGESIATVDVVTTSKQDLAEMMVGRHVSFTTYKEPAQVGESALKVQDLVVKDARDLAVVDDLSFQVKTGEIVGIAGVDGNGQSELILALAGLQAIESGQIEFFGQEVQDLNPRQMTELGFGHIPEDRQRYGLILDMTLAENLVLQEYYQAPYSTNGFFNFEAVRAHAEGIVQDYDVRTTSIQAPARALSGGNQQKAILGRVLTMDPRFIVAANPTRGLDVGAIEAIHEKLIQERQLGKGILLMSFELDEIMNLSDRILVMFEGQIVADVPAHETNEQELGLMMAGTSYEEVLAQRKEVKGHA